MKNIFKIIQIILLILPAKSYAYIIYDAETYDVVHEIAAPIFKAAEIYNPSIFILDDNSPNAFTNGKENIYINSGLIYNFPNTSILRGVIAHEVGHIKSHHISLAYINAINQKSYATLSTIIGIAASALTGSSEPIIQGALTGAHIFERNILKFSRQNETEADMKAIEYLHKSGYSANGLKEFLEYINSINNMQHFNIYELTHPVSRERINLINSKENNNFKSLSDVNLQKKYMMVAAKIMAYTTESPNLKGFSDDSKLYASAILDLKKSRRKEAINKINQLINRHPLNPYFCEFKGQILLKFGEYESLKWFSKAIELNDNIILRVEKEIAVISLSNDKNKIRNALSFFEMNIKKFNKNRTILNYLAIGYGKIGDNLNSMYYRALDKLYQGKILDAQKIAKRALKLAHNNKILILKLNDIINYTID